MVRWLKKIGHIFCVPAALLGEGLVYHGVFLLWTPGGYMPMSARVLLSLALTLLGMCLLRRVPMRTLLLSSSVACLIALAASVIPLFSAGSTVLSTVYQLLRFFIMVSNNLVFPSTAALTHSPSQTLALIFTAVEILFPLVYVFSGLFVRLGVSLRRNTGC